MDVASERASLIEKINNVEAKTFMSVSEQVFSYQMKYNNLFASFVKNTRQEFPVFLPISAFKHHEVMTGNWLPQKTYRSSGTTASVTSSHLIRDESYYLKHAEELFSEAFGPIQDYTILALLPHYLEREDSSLIAMVNHLMSKSDRRHSGYFLYDYKALQETLMECKSAGKKTMLIGVSYALLDFVDVYKFPFPGLTIMETGGMKGRRREMPREELHAVLQKAFHLEHICSEYGMTELLSQCYSKKNGIYYFSKTMRVMITEINDPYYFMPNGKNGVMNIIDLANLDSCAFIATEDLGIVHDDKAFSVLGRLDNSDLRGCNLLIGD